MSTDPTPDLVTAVRRARADGAIEALRSAAEHVRLGAAVGPIPLDVRPAVAAWLCRLAEQRLDRARREAADRLHRELRGLGGHEEEQAPPADRAAMRDRIAAALIARIKQATVSKAQRADALTSLFAATEFDLADAVLAELPEPDTTPRRGDAFEQWLKTQRDQYDRHGESSEFWHEFNDALDRYRLHADTRTPLSEHVCEGRVAGDCDCLEQPAAGAQHATEAGQ